MAYRQDANANRGSKQSPIEPKWHYAERREIDPWALIRGWQIGDMRPDRAWPCTRGQDCTLLLPPRQAGGARRYGLGIATSV
jgi:hypothetical protein